MAQRKGRKNHHAILRHGKLGHDEYRGYSINLGSGKKGYSDCYREIIEKIIVGLENSLELLQSIYVLRFDLMFDDERRSNELSICWSVEAQVAINWFCESVKRYLSKVVKQPRDQRQVPLRNHSAVFINWVREFSSNKGFHYHCYLVLDAKKISTCGESSDSIVSIRSLLDYYWYKAVDRSVIQLGGVANPYVHVNCGNKRAAYIIRNNSRDQGDRAIRTAVYHLSYFAKVRSKLYHSSQGGRLNTHSIAKVPLSIGQFG